MIKVIQINKNRPEPLFKLNQSDFKQALGLGAIVTMTIEGHYFDYSYNALYDFVYCKETSHSSAVPYSLEELYSLYKTNRAKVDISDLFFK